MTRYQIHDMATGETRTFHDWLHVPTWAKWAFEHMGRHRCDCVLAGKHVFYELYS